MVEVTNVIVEPIKRSWLVVSTPLKNMKVSWEYYSKYMESHKIPWFQTTNQEGYHTIYPLGI